MEFHTSLQHSLERIANKHISPFDAALQLTETFKKLMNRISVNPPPGSKTYYYTHRLPVHLNDNM